MSRANLPVHLLVAACLANTGFVFSDEDSSSLPPVKPPVITLLAATRANFETQQLLSLTLEVSNPNDASLVYTGYTPDSFDPPLKAGHIAPLVHIELRREEKWQAEARGFCGTGLAELELAAKSSATFAVTIPADNWQAVKVGIDHHPGWSNEETSTTTIWSTEITREAIEGAAGRCGSQTLPESGLPVGKWNIEFANRVVETCEIREDGTASVVEPQRTSGGKAIVQDRSLIIYFDDDRVERWTKIGERQVVEHWFPASQFAIATPVLGIAERRD
jgi:hypothetical protein